MSGDRSSYRQIFKATSIFGGVQVFNIIISILRGKIVAVLLGPSGMGIAGLLTSSTGFVQLLTSFGLRTSAVKNIAEANEQGNPEKVAQTASVFRKLVWITGLLGTLATLLFAPYLSELAFGDHSQTNSFRWLSVTLLFTQLTNGQFVMLQGMRKLQMLAKANMIGSFIGLLISAPLYYFYGIEGIVPALIIGSISAMAIAYFFGKKVTLKTTPVPKEEAIALSKDMLRMGFMISLSALITTAVAYLVRIYISNTGSIDDVGLYNAGFGILNTYVGLIFAAMGTDYYPRLAGVSNDNSKATRLINQQAEIGILILAPILSVFFIFVNWIIILLFSSEFLAIDKMIHWAALGMYFKVAGWAIAFILLAKGKSRLFFWNELISNAYSLGLNLLGYYLMGLEGLGISFLLTYALYLIQVYSLARFKFQFHFLKSFYRIFVIQTIIGVACFFMIRHLSQPLVYVTAIPVILTSFWMSYSELDKRIGLKDIIKNFRKKAKKNNGE
ncbi:O-antigen translocase [Lentiprolixibacter aurantiacus]|uniref:O-antigen translocase n=1 Tax=Lentiprolixibacter aurantiacus TaxID=2993939 RepID=A0AAE3MLW7_9FLAO|nr:O-antigen translocase [Lentiprolixibacter aurantiacus]MCX2719853.1 O-antigen translocase [Lentiprolixibacter aurantiacus]